MKRSYEKPTLVRRGKLASLAAQQVPSIEAEVPARN